MLEPILGRAIAIRLGEGHHLIGFDSQTVSIVTGRRRKGDDDPFRTLLATKDDAVNMTIDRRRVDEQGRGTYSVSTTFDLHAVGD